MWRAIHRPLTRLRRLFTHGPLSYFIYRYRFLATFTAIGLFSVCLEIRLASHVMPEEWPWLVRATLAFVLGLLCSFALNATVNFRVPRGHLARTFWRFAAVSLLSFCLNMLAVYCFQEVSGSLYSVARLTSAGTFFLIAYALHRRYTFQTTHNLGIALYACEAERIYQAFHKIGRTCDHVHIDLIDETLNPRCSPVDLGRLKLARKLWPDIPLCMHIMSLTPLRWVEQAWDDVDWFLFHLESRDDLLEVIARCRLHRKKVGVVWHGSTPLGDVLQWLPHVDFVMVLGIAEPGRSGQPLNPAALEITAVLDGLKDKYGYELMFDGGVNSKTIRNIRAKYVVAASAILRSEHPILSVHTLQTSAQYDKSAA